MSPLTPTSIVKYRMVSYGKSIKRGTEFELKQLPKNCSHKVRTLGVKTPHDCLRYYEHRWYSGLLSVEVSTYTFVFFLARTIV